MTSAPGLVESKAEEVLVEQATVVTQQDLKIADAIVVAAQRNDLLKSRFDELSIVQTVWVFRRVAIFAFMIYTLNMLDGWQVGSIYFVLNAIDLFVLRSASQVLSSSIRAFSNNLGIRTRRVFMP